MLLIKIILVVFSFSVKMYIVPQKNDTDKVGKPQFRMILTAVGDYAMQLEDGCIVVPIGCLKP